MACLSQVRKITPHFIISQCRVHISVHTPVDCLILKKPKCESHILEPNLDGNQLKTNPQLGIHVQNCKNSEKIILQSSQYVVILDIDLLYVLYCNTVFSHFLYFITENRCWIDYGNLLVIHTICGSSLTVHHIYDKLFCV